VKGSVHLNFVFCSLASLLVGAYLDSVRGPLMPVLTHELGLKYSGTSLFLVLGCVASVGVAFALNPLLNRFGEKAVTQGICVLGIFTVIASTAVKSYFGLLAFALLIGSTVYSFGTICNVLLISGTHGFYRSRFMCALHTVYGLSSVISPVVAASLLSHGFPWQSAMLVTLPILIMLLLCVTKVIPSNVSDVSAPESAKVSGLQGLIILTFAFYVGGEVMTSMWMVTYLVEYRQLTLSLAAPYATGFFLAMAVTRLICFFSLSSRMETAILWGSLILYCLFFGLGHLGFLWAFPLSGVLGPWFPLLLARVSRDFPGQSRVLTIWILTAMQATLAVSHWIVGKSTDIFGIHNTYYLPLGMMLAALVSLYAYLKAHRSASDSFAYA
jgi:fucose permease